MQMALVIAALIVSILLVTYVAVGVLYVSKNNVPNWLKIVFSPYLGFVSLFSKEHTITDNNEPPPNEMPPSTNPPTNNTPPTGESQSSGTSNNPTPSEITPTPSEINGPSSSEQPIDQTDCYSLSIDYNDIVIKRTEKGIGLKDTSIETEQLAIIDNEQIVKDMCSHGRSMLHCTSSSFDIMKNDPTFKKLCCKTDDKSTCTETAALCTIDKSKFYKKYGEVKDFTYGKINLESNRTKLTDFCTLGINIVNNDCKKDELHPMNNDIFRKFCCNDSTDSKSCSLDALSCTFDSSEFLDTDHITSGIKLESIEINKDIVKKYCEQGRSMLDKNCKLAKPMESQHFKDTCCDGSENPLDCTEDALTCIIDTSMYRNRLNSSGMAEMTLKNVVRAKDTVSEFCEVGGRVSDANCKTSIPSNDEKFRNFCCNGYANDPSKCNSESLQCTYDISTFMDIDGGISGLPKTSWGDNKNNIIDYCTTGRSIDEHKCTLYRPTNSKTYTDLCCNGSSNSIDCSESSLQCLIDSIDFINNDVKVANIDIDIDNAISNKDIVVDYCSSGISLSNKKCTQVTPINSGKFRDLCCNSYNSIDKCDEKSLQCIFDSGSFQKMETDMKNVDTSMVSYRLEDTQKFCESGIKLMQDKCNGTIPINSDKFREFCCNDSTDPSKCSVESLKCTTDSSDFINRDYTLQNTTAESAIYSDITKNNITDYCNLGTSLINRKCSNVVPLNFPKFRELCCNNSTDSCNQSSLQCLFDTGNFIVKNDTVSSIPFSNVNYDSSKKEIGDFCNLGDTLTLNKCSIYPKNYDAFRKYCCNNSLTNFNCDQSSRSCVFDSRTFEEIDMSYIKPKSLSSIDPNTLTDFCSRGRDLQNRNCEQTNPMISDSYRNYCCNGSLDKSNCTPQSLTCVYDSMAFDKLNYDLSNVSINSVSTLNVDSLQKISNYCTIGRRINDNNCNQTIPMNSSKFRELCCNNELDKSKCTTQASQCLLDTSSFLQKTPNMDTTSLKNLDIDYTVDFCSKGISLINNSCKLTQPTNSPGFRQFCCNSSTDPTNCNQTSLQCTVDGYNFSDLDRTMQNISRPSIAFGSTVDYCNMGFNMIDKKCTSLNPKTSSAFIDLCCNGSADTCNTKYMNCVINTEKLKSKVNQFIDQGYPTKIEEISVNNNYLVSNNTNIKDYCTTLKSMTGCVYDSVYLNKYSNLCSSVDCLPNYSKFQTTVYSSLGDSEQTKRDNAPRVCSLANSIISQCPSLTNSVKSYYNYYGSYCI